MLDSYIIDFLKEEERKKQEEARIPLYIYPPGFDGYRDNSRRPEDINKKGSVEVDYEVDLDVNKDALVIKM